MTPDTLGDRMKEYEQVTKVKLVRRMPAIIRLDGRAFHTFTRNLVRPYDAIFGRVMMATSLELVRTIQNAVFAYSQSDEISILMLDYKNKDTQAWLGSQVQKIVSLSAAICSTLFQQHFFSTYPKNGFPPLPVFDSRVFSIPESDVVNYFIWRQQDAERNSINSLAQSLFSHAELQGRKREEVLSMLTSIGVEWGEAPVPQKRGFSVTSIINPETEHRVFQVDEDMPILVQDRDYICQYFR